MNHESRTTNQEPRTTSGSDSRFVIVCVHAALAVCFVEFIVLAERGIEQLDSNFLSCAATPLRTASSMRDDPRVELRRAHFETQPLQPKDWAAQQCLTTNTDKLSSRTGSEHLDCQAIKSANQARSDHSPLTHA